MCCEWLIALVMCAANLRAQFCDPAYVITTRSALLCLTSSPKLDIPLQGLFQCQPHALTLKRCAYAVGSTFIFQMKRLRH